MTALNDPFAVVHKKEIKNKAGQVVAQVDYVGWSQVADRLDAAAPGWSFEVVTLHEDWCLGKLTLGQRFFMNVGYAENADMDWKKEPLKDAVSDALKRCAALAGVGRYLYDKDTPQAPQKPAWVTRTPAAAIVGPRGGVATGGNIDEPPWPSDDSLVAAAQETFSGLIDESECAVHHKPWRSNRRGWYCASKLPDGRWCDRTPSADWQMAHDVAGAA